MQARLSTDAVENMLTLIRRLNARLLDGDDRTDLETLPIVRIKHGSGHGVGLPTPDRSFLPACMRLSGSAVLRELVRDLANQVEASRKELDRRCHAVPGVYGTERTAGRADRAGTDQG